MLKTSAGKGRSRRRVALLMDAIEDDYESAILQGAASVAQQHGLELWCLAGGVVGKTSNDPRCARNFLFDLLRPGDFDGILVLSGSLGNQLGVAAFDEWLKRYDGVPMVSMGVELARCPNVIADGAPGMTELLSHLVEQHTCRRIAFVRGPVTSFEAEERFAAYRTVLARFGIAEDPRLILPGDLLRESGAAAVRELFDARGITVEAVSAISCANDLMALGAMDALRDRGVSIPSQIAVTGFDDGEIGKCAVPPLTTVQQPTDRLGREGMRRLLAAMDGTEGPQLIRLPTTLVARRSCGCSRSSLLLEGRSSTRSARSLEAAILERRDLVFAELSRSARGSFMGAGLRWEERLVMAVIADLRSRKEGAFLSALDQLMSGLQRAGGELSQVQPMLGTLRRLLHDCASDDRDAIARVNDLIDGARELVSEWLVRGEKLRRMEVIEFMRALSRVSGRLLRSPVGGHERASFEQGLRQLGFGSLCLGIFEEPGRASEHCQCLAAFESSGRLASQARFRSNEFSASQVFDQERGPLLVQALVYDDEPMGLLTVPLGNYHTSLYEQMRETLANCMRGFRLATRS
ncbi:MAG: substrate-binding domain-containing protein [Polyangiaceae bacterium]